MSIDEKSVQKLADLAKLNLDPGQSAMLIQKLENILTLVGQMEHVDTQDILPLTHSIAGPQPQRADVVTEKNERTQFQALAQSTYAGLYIVPKVIDTE